MFKLLRVLKVFGAMRADDIVDDVLCGGVHKASRLSDLHAN